MAKAKSEMNWKFYGGHEKVWEGSRGTGTYVVQKIRTGWMIARKPWIGNLHVIAVYPTKDKAMQEAERLAK